MRTLGIVGVAVICAAISTSATTQQTVVTPGDTDSVTATIERIDPTDRFLVLRYDDGSEQGVFAPPEFTRFGDLRVGDTLTMTYSESIVYRLVRPGALPPPVSEEVSAQESSGPLPGATVSYQRTQRVTVIGVDRQAPSITVEGRDGQTLIMIVDDHADLDGVEPGARIDIIYTEALLATVSRAK